MSSGSLGSLRGGDRRKNMDITIKVKDEATTVLDKINLNFQQISALLEENKALLEKVVHGSLEIV
jgi:hypothetical protein